MRRREFNRYADLPHNEFAGIESFIESGITAGVLSITFNKAPIDFLAEYRGSATTLVAFHSALTSRQKTVPVFSARATAAEAGVNLIAIADPSVALGVDLAWYIGNRGQGHIRPAITRIVQHLLDAFGSERTILFGSSGGGYAAAYYAPDFPGSVALILNPRLDLSARPRAAMAEYLRVCHKTRTAVSPTTIRANFVPERVSDTYGETMDHHVAILQNEGDRLYLTHQVLPFLKALEGTGKVFARYGSWGEGHRPVPKEVVHEVVTSLSKADNPIPDALAEAGFAAPASMGDLSATGRPLELQLSDTSGTPV